MFNKHLIVGIMIFVLSPNSFADNVTSDIKQLLQYLAKPSPTLADYDRFYGQHDESEADFMIEECKKHGWEPAIEHPKCLEYIRNHEDEANREQTPSMFLAWLKSKLPNLNNPQITIHKIKRDLSSEFEIFHFESIEASINGTKVVFYKSVGIEAVEHNGIISIGSINGVSINQMLDLR